MLISIAITSKNKFLRKSYYKIVGNVIIRSLAIRGSHMFSSLIVFYFPDVAEMIYRYIPRIIIGCLI